MGNSSSEEKASKPKFFDGVKAEFKKITWPDRDLLLRQSVAVVGGFNCTGRRHCHIGHDPSVCS